VGEGGGWGVSSCQHMCQEEEESWRGGGGGEKRGAGKARGGIGGGGGCQHRLGTGELCMLVVGEGA
jgi:hypothetical protein